MLTPPGHGRDLSCPTGRYPKRCSRFLIERPAPATARLASHGDRTLLRVATKLARTLPERRGQKLTPAAPIPTHPASVPTPKHCLHWATSSDDVGAIDALVAVGANIEAPGAVTGGRTPIADATAFGQWDATRRLIETAPNPLCKYWAARPSGNA